MSDAKKSLKKKAEASGIPYGILKQVFNRGMAAWRSGHRPGAGQHQWAHARVNSFIAKKKGTWGGADKDLAVKARESMSESNNKYVMMKALVESEMIRRAELDENFLDTLQQSGSELLKTISALAGHRPSPDRPAHERQLDRLIQSKDSKVRPEGKPMQAGHYGRFGSPGLERLMQRLNADDYNSYGAYKGPDGKKMEESVSNDESLDESRFDSMRRQHFGMSHRDLLHKRLNTADEAKKRREQRDKEHAEFMAKHYDEHGNVKMPSHMSEGTEEVKKKESEDVNEALLGSKFLKKMTRNKKSVEQAKQELVQFMKDNPDKLKKHGIGYWAAQIARKYDGVEGGELVYMITGQKRRKFGHDGGPSHHPLDAIRHMGLSRT